MAFHVKKPHNEQSSKHSSKRFARALSALIACICIFAMAAPQTAMAASRKAADVIPPMVILTRYEASIPIDGEVQLIAVTSNGKIPTFRSSKSSVASVNTYGLITGKKSGTCKITAKIKGAEASCKVTVEKSTVTIDPASATLENGETVQLSAAVSTGHDVKWRSSSSATASVDENGLVTAKKCGSATIRATADGITANCRITVKKPSLSLDRTAVTMLPEEDVKLNASCSSGRPLTYRSSSSAVASVTEDGIITAHKKGKATITVKVDGVSKTCKVTVKEAPEK